MLNGNDLFICITVLVIILILILVYIAFFKSSSVQGAREMDIAEETYNLLKPYVKEQGTKHISEYLENRHDYTSSQIRDMKKKSQSLRKEVGTGAYLYYLIVDIIDKNNITSAYEFLIENDIDYSAFVSDEIKQYVLEAEGNYTKLEEKNIKTIFSKAGITWSLSKLRKFLKKYKYFKIKPKYLKSPVSILKKKTSYEPDIIGLLGQAYLYNIEYDSDEFYIPTIAKPAKPVNKFLEQLKYERMLLDRLKDEKNILLSQMVNAESAEVKKLQNELAQVKSKAKEQEQEIREKELAAKEEYQKRQNIEQEEKNMDRKIFEMQSQKYAEALSENPALREETQRRIDEGEDPRALFDEWLILNNLILGDGDGTDEIEPWEIDMVLKNMVI